MRHDPDAGAWVVEDPGDVRAILLDPVAFPPDNALTAHTPLRPNALRTLASVGFSLPPALANNASPTHRPIRRLVAGLFSPARVAAVEPRIQDLASSAVATVRTELDRTGRADLVALLADVVPVTVLLEMLGLDELSGDVGRLKRWSQDSLELFWGWPDGERQQELAASAAEFYAMLRLRTSTARRIPGSDLFGQLVRLGISDEEVCAAAYFLLVAGHETTAQLISTVLLRQLRQPGWTALGTSEQLAGEAVDLALSQESSVPAWRRTAREPFEATGSRVSAGATLLLRLTGIGGSPELAFGVGTHRCLGAGLARTEATIVLTAAAAALPNLECVEPDPPRTRLLSFSAPRRVVVRDQLNPSSGPAGPRARR